MNRNIFRIIFNASRGLWQVVSEITKACGKSRTSRRIRAVLASIAYYFGKISLARAGKLTASLLFMPFAATAEIIADPNAPGNQRPTIIETSNGLPLVNIQTPSGAGVSRNTYQQFDVDQQGAILNNSRTNTQTQLGGWVEGNPWLAGGSARIILNEVNSSNPSYLRGYLEVAGDRAQVVIANPSGISCDGCGFVNASRGTLTTGVPIFTNGNLDGYRVERGTIDIHGAGLDASRTDYTDLIARAVTVNAGIWAHDLNITAGANEAKADRSKVTPIEAATDEAKPVFAIDTASLGGMYAGKIALIATEAGVGVRNAGYIGASAGEVVLTADGQIENRGQITAKTDLRLNTKQDVQNSGDLQTQSGDMVVNASGKLTNSGKILSGKNTTVNAKTGIANSGTLYAGGDSNLSTEGNIDNSRIIASRGNTQLAANNIVSSRHSLLAAGMADDGTLLDGGNLVMDAIESVRANGQTLAGGDQNHHSASLDFSDGQIVARNLAFTTTGGDLDTRRATLIASDGFTTQVAQAFHNEMGSIFAGHIDISAQEFYNQQGKLLQTQAAQALRVTLAGQLNNTAGSIASVGGTDLQVGDKFTNTAGTVQSDGDMNITADELSGDGAVISAANLNANLARDYTHSGVFQANGKATLKTLGKFTNLSRMVAGDTLQVQAADIDNTASGELVAQVTDLTANNSITNRGLIDGSDTHIKAAILDNIGTGRIYGDRVMLDATTLNNREENNHAAVIAARSRLDIGSQYLTNREHALIFSAGDMFIGGSLDTNGQAQGKAEQINNNSATIQATDGLTLATRQLFNTNEHLTTHEVEVDRQSFDQYQPSGSPDRYNRDEVSFWFGEVWFLHITATGQNTDYYNRYAYDRVTTETQIATTDPAKLLAGKNMHITADNVVNDNSQIIAGGNLTGEIGELTNTEVTGKRTSADIGTAYHYYRIQHSGSDEQGISTSRYAPAPTVESIKLSSAVFQGNVDLPSSGKAIDPIQEIKAIASTDPNAPGLDAIIRSGGVNTTLPDNSLFHINPNPEASGYLIETDPRFANYRNWLSSDFMLSRLGADPNITQKRLGDGFYEQRLINEQIAQLTGRQFLEGYSESEAQYQALMENGLATAEQFNLTPGIALTAEQMSQLSHDIVWLVEKTVTLADGSTTKALVPQVYARVKPGAINGEGALLSGKNVALKLDQDLTNRGTVSAQNQVAISATNLNNLGGRISASDVRLHAQQDINNQGTLDARQNLNLTAGHDINFASTTSSQQNAQGSRTNIDRVATAVVTDAGAQLSMTAGHDINLQAAHVVNNGEGGQTTLAAGNDLNLTTVKTSDNLHIKWDGENQRKDSRQQDVGSQIETKGDIQLLANNNLNAKAATVTSTQGKLLAAAGNDINLTAGEFNQTLDESHKYKGSNGALSKKTITTRDTLDQTQALATTFSADSSSLQAGHNINLVGSNSIATHDNELLAGNDISLQTAQERNDQLHFKQEKTTGFTSGGGFGISYGMQKQSDQTTDAARTGAGSTVGSLEGNINIQAGHNYQQTGSFVSTPKGDINVAAQRIDIQHGIDTHHSTQQSKFEQTGFTLALTSPILSAIQTAGQMKSASQKTDDTRMQALAGATTALAGKNAYDAVAANPETAGGAKITLSFGTSKSESNSSQDIATTAASGLNAGRDINLTATGAGKDSDITVKGSDINAARNLNLKADDEIQLLAGKNTGSQQSTSESSGASIGVSYSMGGQQNGFSLDLGLSKGDGNSNGDSTTWRNSTLTAGNQINLQSGGDTTVKGTVAKADNIVANIGGDLKLQSLQDGNTYHSESSSSSIGVSIPIGAGTAGSVSMSSSSTNMNSNYLSVGEQTGFLAGDQGFQLNVKGNTDLVGAKISSTQAAIDNHKNQLTTGTLTTSDIQNHAEYDADSTSIGGGYSFGGDKGVGQNQQGQAATGGSAVPGTSLPGLNGFSATAPVAMNASDDASSTTKAGISHADIKITDEAKQQQLTGKDAATTISELNRDVSSDTDTSNNLNPIFDPDKIQAGFDIVSGFSHEANTFLTNRIKEADDKRAQAKEALKNANDPTNGFTDTERQSLRDQAHALNQEAQTISEQWGAGGTYRQTTTALVAAASGNISASNSQFVQGLVVNYVQQQGAAYIGKLVVDGVIKEGSPEHAALHAIIACGGAAASGQSCGAGAAGAAASSLITNLFADANPNETDSQREAKRNLVATLVTGIAALEGGDAVAANQGAIAAIDNNWLATQQIVQAKKELAEAKTPLEQLQVLGKWSGTSVKQDLLTGGGIVEGLRDAGINSVQGLGQFLANPVQGLDGLKELINSPEARAQMGEAMYAELSAKIDSISGALTTGGDYNAVQLGRDLGDLIFQAGTVAAGVGGVAKGGVELAKIGINVSTSTLEKMALNLPNVAPGAIHGFESAESLNALMKANEWSPAWKPGTKVADTTLQAGTKVRMVISEEQYNAIQNGENAFGSWATFDDVPNQEYARNQLAISSGMKPNVSYVIEVEITQPVNAKIGVVGGQGSSIGGGNQLHFLIPDNAKSVFKLTEVTKIT